MPPFGLEATKDQPFFYRMHELESPFTIKLSLPEINVSAPENFALLLPRADTTRVDSFADGEQIEILHEDVYSYESSSGSNSDGSVGNESDEEFMNPYIDGTSLPDCLISSLVCYVF